MKEKVIVMDYSTGEVHIYTLPENCNDVEDFLDGCKELSRTKDCHWMIVKEIKLEIHE